MSNKSYVSTVNRIEEAVLEKFYAFLDGKKVKYHIFSVSIDKCTDELMRVVSIPSMDQDDALVAGLQFGIQLEEDVEAPTESFQCKDEYEMVIKFDLAED